MCVSKAAGTLLFFLLLVPGIPGDVILPNRSMFAPAILSMDVREDHIQVDWEIETRVFPAFADILPEEIYQTLGRGEDPWKKRLDRFFQEGWPLLSGDRVLKGNLVSLEGRDKQERDSLTGEVLAGEEKGAGVLAFRFIYPLEGKPERITVSPPPAEEGELGASTGFLVSHLGIPVSEFYFLNREEILLLDWKDPWYSRWERSQLKKAFRSPLNLFLYIENREVRAEVIIRPSDLSGWVDLGLGARGGAITPGQQEAVLARAEGFLKGHVNLHLNGEPVPVSLDRIQFLERSRRGSFIPDPEEDLDPFAVYIGAIYVSPTAGLPQKAELFWDLFPPQYPVISSAAVDEAGGLSTEIIPEFPSLVWINTLTNPSEQGLAALPQPSRLLKGWVFIPGALGLVLLALFLGKVLKGRGWAALGGILLVLGAGGWGLQKKIPAASLEQISPEDRLDLTQALLTNIYRSFDFRDEGDIYDALASSAQGEILQKLFLDTRKAMEIRELGGARVKVSQVQVETADLLPAEDSWVRVRWNVTGTVGHWGHVHTRSNRYSGDLRLDASQGNWKINDFRIREEERIR